MRSMMWAAAVGLLTWYVWAVGPAYADDPIPPVSCACCGAAGGMSTQTGVLCWCQARAQEDCDGEGEEKTKDFYFRSRQTRRCQCNGPGNPICYECYTDWTQFTCCDDDNTEPDCDEMQTNCI